MEEIHEFTMPCWPRISVHAAATSGMTSVTSGSAATQPANAKRQRATRIASAPPTTIEVAVTAPPRMSVFQSESRYGRLLKNAAYPDRP